MTFRECRDWLYQYRDIQREIKDVELRITQLRLKYAAPSAISYSDMPKAHGNIDLSDYMAKLEQYEQMLIDKHTECLGLSVQYLQAFDYLDREEAHVLKRLYMDGAKVIKIANEIPCAERTVYYIRRKAIKKLCSKLQ